MNFKVNLTRIMKEKEISAKYLYEKLEISKANYYGMLKNDNPTYKTLQKIKEILQCDYNDLLK